MLNHVDDRAPGITRLSRGKQWHYFDSAGARIRDAEEIARLNKLGVPPAYQRVWFCADATGHLQAIGYDARGRKQYRYHAEFRAAREAHKYDRCAAFGEALPKLRAAVASGEAQFELAARKTLHFGWEPIAKITLTKESELDQETLRFDPYQNGSGIVPVGVVNTIRKRVYPASQAARPDHVEPVSAS